MAIRNYGTPDEECVGRLLSKAPERGTERRDLLEGAWREFVTDGHALRFASIRKGIIDEITYAYATFDSTSFAELTDLLLRYSPVYDEAPPTYRALEQDLTLAICRSSWEHARAIAHRILSLPPEILNDPNLQPMMFRQQVLAHLVDFDWARVEQSATKLQTRCVDKKFALAECAYNSAWAKLVIDWVRRGSLSDAAKNLNLIRSANISRLVQRAGKGATTDLEISDFFDKSVTALAVLAHRVLIEAPIEITASPWTDWRWLMGSASTTNDREGG